MLGHKTSHKALKKMEIISRLSPPNYSGRKVEINYEKKAEKLTNMWRLRWFSR